LYINKIKKMKKVQYISDLHLEMYPNGDYWAENKIEPVADILVLAGDISKLSKIHYSNPFFDQVSKDFKQVFWVPGNHEYYDLTDLNLLNKESLDIDIRDNVKIVNNKSINYDGINFIFSTFWSEIPISYARNVTRGMMCFRKIKYLGNHFEAKYIDFGKYNRLHQDSVYFLKNALADIDNEDPIVVVTHHAPTIYVVSDEFKASTIRHGFYSEQMPLIKSSRFIDYWIYGHTHRNVDFELDGTQIVSNQQGYVHMGEHATFNPTKYIEL